jgi:hypothetical protein
MVAGQLFAALAEVVAQVVAHAQDARSPGCEKSASLCANSAAPAGFSGAELEHH